MIVLYIILVFVCVLAFVPLTLIIVTLLKPTIGDKLDKWMLEHIFLRRK